MEQQKSFNLRSLRGDDDYDDYQFQTDMKETGINIPDEVLFTPELNQLVAGQMREKNIKELQKVDNPETSMPYTLEEATRYADDAYKNVMEKTKLLSK